MREFGYNAQNAFSNQQNKFRGFFYCVYLIGLYLPALESQMDFENLALRAGQNEAGQTKGRPKLGQLKFFAQNNWTCSIVYIQSN